MMTETGPLVIAGIVFATVFVAILAVGQRMFASPGRAASTGPGPDAGKSLRTVVRTALRVLSWIVLAYLVTITIISYSEGSPDDGSYLITGVLAIATLLLGSYLQNLDRRLQATAMDPAASEKFLRGVKSDFATNVAGALLDGTTVELSIAEPEVHAIDIAGLDRARTMLAHGKSMDEVCRAAEPAYGDWDIGHQQAFQAVMRAAVEGGWSRSSPPKTPIG